MTSDRQKRALEAFDREHIGLSKGALSFVLIITRKLRSENFPINANKFRTEKEGQVKGLGGGAIRKILKDHGIERVLSDEGGRTSRGNMGRLTAYVDLLNDLHRQGELSLDAAENFWIDCVRNYFDAQPFTFKLDPSKSLRFSVRQLLSQAIARQREVRGTMYAGAVMQHLVGAKLDLVTQGGIDHHGFSVADAPSNRSGDFLIADVAIHVTTAPTDALVRKCKGNLESGFRPLVVTTEDGVGGIKALAKDAELEDRIDVIEIEQFIATNLYERSKFDRGNRVVSAKELFERYNDIIEKCESDPSLRIEFDLR